MTGPPRNAGTRANDLVLLDPRACYQRGGISRYQAALVPLESRRALPRRYDPSGDDPRLAPRGRLRWSPLQPRRIAIATSIAQETIEAISPDIRKDARLPFQIDSTDDWPHLISRPRAVRMKCRLDQFSFPAVDTTRTASALLDFLFVEECAESTLKS